MGLALSLRSDHPSAEAIRSLRRGVAPLEDEPSMAALGYPPHITLAVYDAVDEPRARGALRRAAEGLPALSLAFDAVRWFDGPPMVLWAAPRPSEPLLAAHAAVHAAVDPTLCRAHYRPGSWVPHCTLGTRVRDDRRAAALAFAATFRGPVEVVFDALDCVLFPPLAGVELRRLP